MSVDTILELKRVSRRFGNTQVLDAIDVAVSNGSFTALLGASGCGKSTTLRIMAGLDRPSEGKVLLNGEDVAEQSAYERNIAMVFQSYALYPHLTVFQNMALPLTMRYLNPVSRLPLIGLAVPGSANKRQKIRKKVEEAAEILGLSALLDRKPAALSGGQKQRVALGRALVRDPVMFLLDEPLSNLDARLRIKMRSELNRLHKKTGRSFVYVTHDQAEAMAMADRIIVMMAGKVAQAGSPRELYDTPNSRDVAAFIGANAINLFEPSDQLDALHPAAKSAHIGIRPEHLVPAANGPLSARLESAEFQGSEVILGLRSDKGKEIRAIVPGDYAVPGAGSEVRLTALAGRLHLFDAQSGKRIEAEAAQ